MWLSEAPRAVVNFIEIAQAGTINGLLVGFTTDAVVLDSGREYRGQAIEQWAGSLIARPRRTVRPIRAIGNGGETVMTVIVQDIGSGEAEYFEWVFTTSGQKISALSVRTPQLRQMPSAVAAYVLATNLFDIDGLLNTFAEDAIVNDQLYEFRGRVEIGRWALRDIIGQHTTIYVTKALSRYTDAVVTAHVDGSYDKRGLPNPLVLTFYFSIHAEKIVQLIILRNESRA
jgi:hypothetical protein